MATKNSINTDISGNYVITDISGNSITVDSSGSLIVIDSSGNYKITDVNSNSIIINDPTVTITTDFSSNIFVTDSSGDYFKLDSSGHFLSDYFIGYVNNNTNINVGIPVVNTITTNTSGNFVITDISGNSSTINASGGLIVHDSSGNYVISDGANNSIVINNPGVLITTDASSNIMITDSLGNYFVINSTGTFIRDYFVGLSSKKNSITVDSSGNYILVDSSGELITLDSSGSIITSDSLGNYIITDTSGDFFVINQPNTSITVDVNSNIFIKDSLGDYFVLDSCGNFINDYFVKNYPSIKNGSYIDLSRNIPPDLSVLGSYYNGLFYAIVAMGGYTIEQGFSTIKLALEKPMTRYDLTQALQVRLDVRDFNKKIGVIKDVNNIGILDSSYNPSLDRFPIDTLTLSAAEFVSGMSSNQVISVGTYSTMYRDFNEYVNNYFGYAGGFASLFSNSTNYAYNNGVFDASSVMNIITSRVIDSSGEYVNSVTGNIIIYNVNNLLRFAVDSNVFSNRDPVNGNTASDPTNHANYGLADGFYAGDLILVPNGTTITLNLGIDLEAYSPINNTGPSTVSAINQMSNFSQKYLLPTDSGYPGPYSEATSASLTKISRTLTAPLLIRLDNLS